MAERTRQLGIDIEPGPGPPRGWIRDAHGVTHPFSGWLGLASVLGRVLEQSAPARDRPAADNPTTGGSS